MELAMRDMSAPGKMCERKTPVTVITDDGDPVPQPKSFQFCPLGLQFYSRKELSECSLLEFKLNIPGDHGRPDEITCSGLVVNCREEPSHKDSPYRIWVKFLDLPEAARDRIHCVAKSSDFLCPFCENF